MGLKYGISARDWRDIGKRLTRYWRDIGKRLAGYRRNIGTRLTGYWRDIGKRLAGECMRIGKLSNELLESMILGKLKRHDGRIISAAGIGEDCGVVDYGENCCIISGDPVTGAARHIGSISVHVACNDIAAYGVRPLAIIVVILIPPHFQESDVEMIVNDLIKTADSIKVSVIGGHTEVTDAVTRAVISITAIGITEHGKYVTTRNAQVGDTVIMTKKAGLEGAAIIAADMEDVLKPVFGAKMLAAVMAFSDKISVIEEGVIAREMGAAHAMHDITEGGVYGAAWEMAEASGVGIEIFKENIPIMDETVMLCEHLKLDPYRLTSSGSMMIATDIPAQLEEKLHAAGIECARIGRIIGDRNSRYVIDGNGCSVALESPGADELYKVL